MGSISMWKYSIYSWKYKTKLRLGLKKYIWVIYLLRIHPDHRNKFILSGAGLQRWESLSWFLLSRRFESRRIVCLEYNENKQERASKLSLGKLQFYHMENKYFMNLYGLSLTGECVKEYWSPWAYLIKGSERRGAVRKVN